MERMRNGGSTGTLLRGLRELGPTAEVIDMHMNERTQPVRTAVDPMPRGTTGLGAITVMFFTVVVYAAIFGALAVVGWIRGSTAGHGAGALLVIGLVLLTPAVAVVVTTLRRPAGRR